MNPATILQIGARVVWRSYGGWTPVDRIGRVICIVPAASNAGSHRSLVDYVESKLGTEQLKHYKLMFRGQVRPQVCYIIEELPRTAEPVGKPRLYCPHVRNLALIRGTGLGDSGFRDQRARLNA